MDDTNLFQCSACQKIFSTNFNRRKHIRKFHPDKVNVLAPSRSYNFQCTVCNKNFTHLRHFRIHEKRHRAACVVKKEKKCMICDYCGLETDLLHHFTKTHSIELQHIFMGFASLSEFHTWKTGTENDSRVQFIRKQKPFSTKAGQVFKYVCHRSGTFSSKSTGLRRLKSQGSRKICGFCPASMKVILKDNGKCEVAFINTHVGHMNDVDHVWLNLSERETLAAKIAKQIPFKDILVEAQTAQTVRVQRLKRKDLHNIKRSFLLKSKCTQNKGSFDESSRDDDNNVDQPQVAGKEMLDPAWDSDVPTEDCPEDLQSISNVRPDEGAYFLLQERKEKLKTSLCKFVNKISCSKEADILEEAFIQISSTLQSRR